MKEKRYNISLNNLSNLSVDEKEKILNEIRNDIDNIDEKLAKLFSKRTYLSLLIGRIKKSLKLPTYNPDREREIINRITQFIEEPMKDKSLERIYERILDESRAAQKNDT